jgi:hypothetical protein
MHDGHGISNCFTQHAFYWNVDGGLFQKEKMAMIIFEKRLTICSHLQSTLFSVEETGPKIARAQKASAEGLRI